LWKTSPASWSDFYANEESVAGRGAAFVHRAIAFAADWPVCGGMPFFFNLKGLQVPLVVSCHQRGLEIDTMRLL
jgi:hypothetical protein